MKMLENDFKFVIYIFSNIVNVNTVAKIQK